MPRDHSGCTHAQPTPRLFDNPELLEGLSVRPERQQLERLDCLIDLQLLWFACHENVDVSADVECVVVSGDGAKGVA